ncbi:MAG: hypothetical protein V7707_08220 [Motiliproteus sp.]
MDRISIINGAAGDDAVIKNDRVFHFPLDKLLSDPAIWAVQWYGDQGEIEYSDKAPKPIGSLNEFVKVLAEFDRLADAEDNPPPPPEPTVDEAKKAKLALINAAADNEMMSMLATYPPTEVTSWDKQEQEARAYLADNTATTPLLAAIAAARGLPLATLAERVVVKADLFAVQSGAIFGQRQALEDDLNVIDDTNGNLADVDAVTWLLADSVTE